MTALDILKKKQHENAIWFTEGGKQVALAAMREIYEMGDKDGRERSRVFLLGLKRQVPDLETKLKELFPEK